MEKPRYSAVWDSANGELHLTLPPDSPCTEVLLEFDAKLIWVSGPDRVWGSGAAAFRVWQGNVTQTLICGAVNEATLTTTISVFFRDTDGGVLATQDSVVHFKKSPDLPEPINKFLNTVDWVHRRLNVATWLIFTGALVVGSLWAYLSRLIQNYGDVF